MKEKFALVLQGGGVRGAFTAGVLDVFMEHSVEADYIIGVSAGALNATNYVSKQIGRSKWVTIELINDKKFKSTNNVVKNKSLFNFYYLFNSKDPNNEVFHFDNFMSSKIRYIAVASNCLTGEAIYFEKGKCSDIKTAIEASASLPLVSKPVLVENIPCLDGGITVAVPIKKAIEDGYKKIVVVLTRDKMYRKDEKKKNNIALAKMLYKQYPKFISSYRKQARIYNNCLDYVDRLEHDKMIFVIRPDKPITISHTETNKKKLTQLYNDGRDIALSSLIDLEKYLDE